MIPLGSISHSMVLVHLLELNVAGPSYMGRDRNIGNVVVTAHEYISICLELDLLTKWYHLVELWENFLILLLWHPGRGHLCLV